MTAPLWLGVVAVVGSGFMVGCSTAPPRAEVGQQAPGGVARALQEARRNPAVRRQLVLEAEGHMAEGVTGVLLFGDGVGVLNGKRQFRASDETLVAVLDLLILRDVASWPEESPLPGNAMEIHRRLTIRLGEVSHQVIERNKRPPRPPLQELLRDLAELVRPAAASGVEVSSLEEGLRLIAEGALAPHVLTVNALAPSMPGAAATPADGWQLSLHRGVFQVSAYDLSGGVRPISRRAALGEVAGLAQLLLDTKAATLPRQIHLDEGFFQLHLEVLDQRLSVQARPFAGKGATQGLAARETLLAVRDHLRTRFEEEVRAAEGSSEGD